MAGQRAALGDLLAFTRAQEATADATCARLLSKSGITGKGILQFFGKLQNQEYRLAIYDKDSFDRTHPLSSERIQALEQKLKNDPAWNSPVDAALDARFQRVKAKLMGFVNPRQAVLKYPEGNQTIPAHYARAYAYHLGGYPQKAEQEANSLLAIDPHDPFFLELKGQILLEDGKPKDSLVPLREAVERSNNAPMIAAMLGHGDRPPRGDRRRAARGGRWQASSQFRWCREAGSRRDSPEAYGQSLRRRGGRAPACGRTP